MADHNKPTTASAYAAYTSELDSRFDDLTLGLDPAFVTATNLPTNSLRFSSAAAKWQRWNGSSWVDPVATYSISISGNAGTVTNGVYTNGTYADPAWLTSLAGSKITGNISGNAGTATTLQTARTINGVSFNGSANISVNLNSNVTFNNAGSGAASGVTFNGGSAVTVSYNTVGAPSATGANASGTWGISITGNAATATSATSATTAGTCTGNAATATTAASVVSTVSNRVGDLAIGSGEALIYSYATNAIAMRLGAAGSYKQHNFAANGDVSLAGGLTASGGLSATGGVSAGGAVTGANLFAQSQSWQSPARALDTVYTNNTGRPIEVSVSISLPNGATTSLSVSGVVVSRFVGRNGAYIQDTFATVTMTAVVPAGATYSASGGSLVAWAELR